MLGIDTSQVEVFASLVLEELTPGQNVLVRPLSAAERAHLVALFELDRSYAPLSLIEHLKKGHPATLSEYVEGSPPAALAALLSQPRGRAEIERMIGAKALRSIAESWIGRATIGDGDFHPRNLVWSSRGPLGVDFEATLVALIVDQPLWSNPLGLDQESANRIFVAAASDEFWSRLSALNLPQLRALAVAADLRLNPKNADLERIIAQRDEFLRMRSALVSPR